MDGKTVVLLLMINVANSGIGKKIAVGLGQSNYDLQKFGEGYNAAAEKFA